ncbi:MAG: DHH family phosphoesterase [Christensenellales bacterium]
MTLDNILEEIKKAESIVILTHENPDGDAVGSSIAMYLGLKELGKTPDIIIPEFPRAFENLPGIENIKKESDIENYDLAIALDTASIKMLNGYSKYFEDAKTKIVIDHHSSNTMFGDYNYVDQDSPACAQLLLVLFNYLNIEVSKEIGTDILAGIITDTGGFRYDGVTAETFELVAGLCQKGVKVSKVYQKVFASTSKSKFFLHRIALDRLELLDNEKIAFTYITKKDENSVGAENGDYDGIVEQGRDIEGVEISIFLRETEKGIKASLRSKDYVNVSELCRIFGGGGHIRAAGCTIPGTIEQVKTQILNQARAMLK